jgi:hypothetical protein
VAVTFSETDETATRMDAQYLKKNVHEALIEALASMAIALPDDGIEYLGKYLVQYVERQELQKIVRGLS